MENEDKSNLITEEEEFDEVFIDKTYMIWAIPLRLLVLLSGTLLVSLFYKAMIEMGVFKLIRSAVARAPVYCLFELALLVGFWRGVFIFSKKCKHRSHSLRAHYLMIGIVAFLYTGICCAAYRFLSRDMFSWLFRITLNLCGLRLKTSFPKNLTPYLVAYLIITNLIMLLEPVIAKKRYERFVRMMEGIPDPLDVKMQALLDPIYERRYEKAVRRKKKQIAKSEKKELRQEERYQRRKERWKKKMKKRKQRKMEKAMKNR